MVANTRIKPDFITIKITNIVINSELIIGKAFVSPLKIRDLARKYKIMYPTIPIKNSCNSVKPHSL